MSTELTVVELPDPYESNTANTPVNPGFVAADTTGNFYRNTGRELVLLRNNGAVGRTITVTSQPHSRTGRLGDITAAAVAASAVLLAFQIFPPDGWASGGVTTLTANHLDVQIAVLRGQLQGNG